MNRRDPCQPEFTPSRKEASFPFQVHDARLLKAGLWCLMLGAAAVTILVFAQGCAAVPKQRRPEPTACYRESDFWEAFQRCEKVTAVCPWKTRVFIPAGTGSMMPVLDEGCLLLVAYKPFDQVQLNEIIGYDRKNHPGWNNEGPPFCALHRVYRIERDGNGKIVALYTWGDNNQFPDEGIVSAKSYQYTVIASVRFKDVPWHQAMTKAQYDLEILRQMRWGGNQTSNLQLMSLKVVGSDLPPSSLPVAGAAAGLLVEAGPVAGARGSPGDLPA